MDSVIYIGSSDEILMDFKSNMLKTFEMLNHGQLKYFVGLEMKQSTGSLFVTQQKYVEDLLKKAGRLHYKSMTNPMYRNEKKLHLLDNSSSANLIRYIKLVGGLLYLTQTS